MPQIEDLGATDELLAFKDEGDQDDKRTASSERDLDDVKSSLVNESESSSDSEADRRSRTDADLQNRIRHSHLFQEALRRQQDGGLFQPPPYVGYPFFMIPDLGNLCGPYLANAALPPSARTPCSLYASGSVLIGVAKRLARKEEEKKPHIKKPLNAFMLYMREERPNVVAQCRVKESATINQILGQRWHSLSKEEQSKYYELARKERLLHSRLYPGWSARDNYVSTQLHELDSWSHVVLHGGGLMVSCSPPGRWIHGLDVCSSDEKDFPPQMKRPCEETQRTHPRSHLTHTHLSQASPASSLDSPATPTTALASPAPPAPTHTEHTLCYGGGASPYAEQLQPLALTTKPHRTPQTPHPLSRITPEPVTPTSSHPPPFLPPPPPAAHGALTQSQLGSLRRTNQL
ncbi:transcription factor 7-like 1-A [Pseudoliparis swirei]|uniref:transcription factor 7-like 1-A n=1 Tax=Pseudoliparis swirei TaxID=2059687 RepID=UPI0024BEE39C|nr:transcription factor 7-like 1-A [Pseudoliparis swirei]